MVIVPSNPPDSDLASDFLLRKWPELISPDNRLYAVRLAQPIASRLPGLRAPRWGLIQI